MTKELLDYFKGDEMAASVWEGKYAQKGEKTPDDMHKRMAKEFARTEDSYNFLTEDNWKKLSEYGKSREHLTFDRIYRYFKDFKYIIPQGSVMSQLGSKSIGSLSNCFVIGQPEDSYGGIFQKEEQMVQLMKRRGGVGIDLSTLRPDSAPTTNAAKSSTGAISFMNRYSNGTREVAQKGRRGALMISMNVNHPDILDFIKIKRDLTKITGANISVGLTNEFMEAVEADEDYYLKFPVDADISGFPIWSREASMEYNKLETHEFLTRSKSEGSQTVYIKRVRAKEIWDEIITSAHGYAEPGLFFIDNHYNYSPDGVYPQYRGITTNPCGEIFMQPHDACRLIAVNLLSFVESPYTPEAYFNKDKFYEVIYEAMRLSDDLVDLELEHIDRILAKIESDPEEDETKRTELDLWEKTKATAKASRRTGLGFTALGDMLAALDIKYDSPEGIDFVDYMMQLKMEAELDCTTDMAITRGSFEGHNIAREFDENGGRNDFYQALFKNFPNQVKRMIEFGRRNVSWSTVAPTGSLSMLAQVSSGMEPVFMLWYMRRKKVNPGDKDVRVDFTDQNGDTWQEYPVMHESFKKWLETKVSQVEGLSNSELKEWAEKSPWNGSTAPDIDWVERVQMQSIIQKFTSHSISSTINLPNEVKEEQVSEIYLESWKRGLKGVTVYRDGSRSGVLVSTEEKKDETPTTKFGDHHAPSRGKSLDAKLVRFNNNKEKWIAFVGLMDDKPYEVFTGKLDEIKIPKKIEEGKIVKSKLENGSKNYSFDYEGGAVENINQVFNSDFYNYAKMISGVLRHGMPLPFVIDMVSNFNFAEDHINTWKNGVARTLKRFIKDGDVDGIKCQDCGGRVHMEEGCLKCIDCGSSKCG